MKKARNQPSNPAPTLPLSDSLTAPEPKIRKRGRPKGPKRVKMEAEGVWEKPQRSPWERRAYVRKPGSRPPGRPSKAGVSSDRELAIKAKVALRRQRQGTLLTPEEIVEAIKEHGTVEQLARVEQNIEASARWEAQLIAEMDREQEVGARDVKTILRKADPRTAEERQAYIEAVKTIWYQAEKDGVVDGAPKLTEEDFEELDGLLSFERHRRPGPIVYVKRRLGELEKDGDKQFAKLLRGNTGEDFYRVQRAWTRLTIIRKRLKVLLRELWKYTAKQEDLGGMDFWEPDPSNPRRHIAASEIMEGVRAAEIKAGKWVRGWTARAERLKVHPSLRGPKGKWRKELELGKIDPMVAVRERITARFVEARVVKKELRTAVRWWKDRGERKFERAVTKREVAEARFAKFSERAEKLHKAKGVNVEWDGETDRELIFREDVVDKIVRGVEEKESER